MPSSHPLNGDGETCLHSDTQADVLVQALPSGKHRIRIQKRDHGLHVPFDSCETTYPIALINSILAAKGPAYLIDEILRDESPGYVQHDLKWSVLSYLGAERFAGKRILDFGCGSGSSSLTLARMFPASKIVGVELRQELLHIADARVRHYRFGNIDFHLSPAPDKLPPELGTVDFVILSAVYEHLLPGERKVILSLLWQSLNPGGVLFLNATPNRNFPLEMHTTGLPAINYLPDRWAHLVSKKFSPRNLENESWESLLRAGIRGGTIKEIVGNLPSASGPPILLEPAHLGITDRIDLWLALTSASIGRTHSPMALLAKRIYRRLMKPIKQATGIEFLPELALALQKPEHDVNACPWLLRPVRSRLTSADF